MGFEMPPVIGQPIRRFELPVDGIYEPIHSLLVERDKVFVRHSLPLPVQNPFTAESPHFSFPLKRMSRQYSSFCCPTLGQKHSTHNRSRNLCLPTQCLCSISPSVGYPS